MQREQKAAAIAEIAESITTSQAVFAVDYRGISVTQAAELRARLRDVDATFRVVKNTLTVRAADEAGAEELKAVLQGPTALTFVRGDAALAARALRTFGRETQLLQFKGGLLNGSGVDAEQIAAIAQLPSREVLYGQLVGVVAAPITGLARGLNALISGVAIALAQVRDKMESGELAVAAPAPAGAEVDQDAEAPVPAVSPQDPAEGPDDAAAAGVPAVTEVDQDAEAPVPAVSPQDPAEGPDDAAAAGVPAVTEVDQDAEAPVPAVSPQDPAEGPDDAAAASAPVGEVDQDSEPPEPAASPQDPAEGPDDGTAPAADEPDQDAAAPERTESTEDPAEGADEAS